MAVMTEEKKALLREYARKKRAKELKLKDLAPWELAVACDAAKEQGYGEQPTREIDDVRHLRYASAEQLQAICGCLECETGKQRVPDGYRLVKLFDRRALVAMFRALGMSERNIDRYVGCKNSVVRIKWWRLP